MLSLSVTVSPTCATSDSIVPNSGDSKFLGCSRISGIPFQAVADSNGLCMDIAPKRSAAFATSALEPDRRSQDPKDDPKDGRCEA